MKILLVNLVLAASFAASMTAQAAQVETCTMSDGSKQTLVTPSASTVQSVSSILAIHLTEDQKNQAILKAFAAEASEFCAVAAPEYTLEGRTLSTQDCLQAMSSEGMLDVISDSKPVSSSLACQIGYQAKFEVEYGDMGFGDVGNQY